MKVLYILDYGTVGGATHSFIELVSQMKQNGVTPIVCLGKKTDIIELLDRKGIEYFCAGHRTVLEPFIIRGFTWPLSLGKLYFQYWVKEFIALYRLKKIDWSQIDLVHTNSARNDIGCFINKKYGIPHIMHIREFADEDFHCISFRPNFTTLFNQYTTHFISISDSVKQHWLKKGIKREKIDVIYNGINFEDITVSGDNEKRNSFKMFIAGGVIPAKGQHLAVQAMGYLPKDIRGHVTLDVAGWGGRKYIEEMKKYAEERGYESQIHFLGSINDVHKRLGNYQVGLMCSRAEGFGRVTAEYMHAQLGVIASDSGANPELIQDGINGLLFKSGDAQSLAECILKLYNDRELLVRLSHAAQIKARASYTQQKNAESIYKVYQEFIQKD